MLATAAIPATHTAILQQGGGKLAVVHDAPVPKLLPGWLLVRNVAVALNPCDFKMAARFPTSGLKDGVDFAGTVAALGDRVTGFSVGDRVFGCVPSNKQDDSESGSFSEYVKVEAIYTLRIPPAMTFETAMALNPACISTVALALHQSLGLPATPDEAAELGVKAPDTVLVYGGSSSVGLLAIQMLKLCVPWHSSSLFYYSFSHRLTTCPVFFLDWDIMSSQHARLATLGWSNNTGPTPCLTTAQRRVRQTFEHTPGTNSEGSSTRSERPPPLRCAMRQLVVPEASTALLRHTSSRFARVAPSSTA